MPFRVDHFRLSFSAGLVLTIAAGALAAACSNSAQSGVPSSLVYVAGDSQSGAAGSGLPTAIIVMVDDGNGHGVPNVQVNFVATGGAVLADSIGTTDASGRAQTTVVLGHIIGTDTVRAWTANVLDTLRFPAKVVAGAANTLTLVSGNGQVAPRGTMLSAPFTVLVQDQYGNPVDSTSVTWTATGGGLGPVMSTSDLNGRATMQYTLPAIAGTDTVTATLVRGSCGAACQSTVVFTVTGT